MQHTTTHRRRHHALALLSLCWLLALLPGRTLAQANTIYYVRTNGSDASAGTSWDQAFLTLQKALATASSGAQIWVAQGTYYPDEGAGFTDNDRLASFTMKNGVAIYGGFPAIGSPTFTDRNWAAYETILSGDIDKNDAIIGNSNNSLWVIRNFFNDLDKTALLDGFTISGGNANASGFTAAGGGMWNRNSSPMVSNCRFMGNSSRSSGGGTYNESASPIFINCSFIGNRSNRGGGMHNVYDSPTLTNCSFSGNIASGGTDSNTGGGGMFNSQSSPTLTNCSFSGNSASGGDRSGGGGMYNRFSSPTLTNCSLSGNSGTGRDFSGGGGMYNSTSSPTLTNCIVWGNSTGILDAGAANIQYSLVQEINTSSNNNIPGTTDPLFVDAASGNLRLQGCSPVINKGLNSANTTTTDLAGNLRKVSDNVDLGAYEYQGAPIAITNPPPVNATVCAGSPVEVLVEVSGTVGRFEWYKDEQLLSDQTSSTLTLSSVSVADAGSYTMKVIGACNTLTTDAYVLTVDPASVGGSVSGGTTVCTGSNSTELTLTGQTGAIQKWQSSTDGQNWTDLAHTGSAYTALGLMQTTSFRAVVQSGLCAPAFSEAATVTVGQPPVVSAGSCRTIYLGYGEACPTLSATADQSGLSYAWTGGGVGASVQVCPTATTTYTVTAQNAAGCAGSASVQVEVLDIRSIDKNGKVKIWVCDGKKSKLKKPEDVAKYLTKGYTLGPCGLVPCSGQPAPIAVAVATRCNLVYKGYGSGCLTLEANATGGYGELKFNWGPGLDGASVQVCPDKKTKYTLTVTDAHGYVATEEVEVDVQDVRCGKDKAGVELCYQGKNLCVAAGEVAGYLAQGARLGKCSDKPCKEDEDGDASRIGVAEELTDLPVELAVEVYPNPSSGAVTLRVRTSVSGPGSVEVLDLTGRAVQSEAVELLAGDNELKLDVAAQPSGLYILRVRDAAGRQGAVRLSRQ